MEGPRLNPPSSGPPVAAAAIGALLQVNPGGGNDSTCMDELMGLMLRQELVLAPSWESVSQELKWAFSLHAYTFACLFFVLSFYTFFSFLNLRSLTLTPPLMPAINFLLCLLGATRSGCLFIDPYSIKEIMPKGIGPILWDIGFPLITSAFGLIHLAFFQLSQAKFKLARLECRHRLLLYAFMLLHVCLPLLVDSGVLLGLYPSRSGLSLTTQGLLCHWALLVFSSSLYADCRLKALAEAAPSNLLGREPQRQRKGAMLLAALAPCNNLASSVAAALVPTLLGQKLTGLHGVTVAGGSNGAGGGREKERDTRGSTGSGHQRLSLQHSDPQKHQNQRPEPEDLKNDLEEDRSTVPEVYVRPPTPTPSLANLPIITVSSPSRRSSLAGGPGSRRGSDVSGRNSRRASDCSVRFAGGNPDDETDVNATGGKRSPDPSSTNQDGSIKPLVPEQGCLRRNSDCGPSPSREQIRRGSDFGNASAGIHDNKPRSQFATKLRRNSDFGNRQPRRAQPESDSFRLARILDVSPTGSRRNSDLGGLLQGPRPVESRRNSDVSYRSCERRGSDVSRRGSTDSRIIPKKSEQQQLAEIKSESDSDQTDETNQQQNERTALVEIQEPPKSQPQSQRKKSLSWKGDPSSKSKSERQQEITAETSLLPEQQNDSGITSADLTLHSILNHIAYVSRTKSDTPLHIPEASTAVARRAQIRRLLNVSCATAILGLLLCLADAARILGPYGLFADTVKPGTKPSPSSYPKPWPWIVYQTLCRLLELAMGCAMASITKQPSASPRHQYLSKYPSYHLRMKQRDPLYI